MWPGHNGPNVFLYESKATIPKKSNTITIMIMNVINSAFSPAYLSTLWQWRANTGVLVAISIPIFTSQLEKAREANDMANLRSAYAEVSAAALTEDTTNMTKTVPATQKEANWQTNNVNIGGITSVDAKVNGNWNVTYNNTSGAVEIN